MSSLRFLLALLVLPLLLACQSKSQAQAAASAALAKPEEPAKTDDWQRMKECAQQAERMVKRFEWVEGKDGLTGWENHYSPKFGRCFVAASFTNDAAKKDRELPVLYDQLFDAFEGRLLAICTDAIVPKANFFCTVQDEAGPKFDCGGCRQYVQARMRR